MQNLVLVFPGRPIEVDKVGWWRKSLSVVFSRFRGVVVDVKYEEISTDGCEGGWRGGEVIGGRERVREIFFRNRAKHLESGRDVEVLFQ